MKDWKHIKLGDLFQFKNGINFTKHQKGVEGTLTIDVLNMYANGFNASLNDLYRVNKSFSDDYFLEEGDLLFVRSSVKREGVGWPSLFSGHPEPVTFCGFIIRARPTQEALASINLSFLIYLLRGSEFRSKIVDSAKQSTITNINQSILSQVLIPLPPLSEQKRIVAILDEVFAGIDDAIANTEKNLTNARELFESYLNAVFLDGGDSWIERKLGDTEFLRIIDGDRGKNYPKKSDFLVEGHCLFLNTKNVRPDGFDFETTMFITEEKDAALRKGKLSRRDVILTTRGTIGNIAIYDNSVEYDHIRINSGMLILRPNEKVIISEFLFEMLRSSIVKVQIEKRTSGAAQPQLPIKTSVDFTVPVPTELDEQSRIVLALNEIHTETQRLEAIYQQKLTALNELKQSILQKAFTGALTADTASQAEKAKDRGLNS